MMADDPLLSLGRLGPVDRMLMHVAPVYGQRRIAARLQSAQMLRMHYDAASTAARTTWTRSRGDGDAAAAGRTRIAYAVRDMTRNNPWAKRGRDAIVNNVVGDGVIPKITGVPDDLRNEGQAIIEALLDTTAIDAGGRTNLYGLQQQVMGSIIEGGDALIVPRFLGPAQLDAKAARLGVRRETLLPLELRVMEGDYLNDALDGLRAPETENEIFQGIEYAADGRRVAYHLFDMHPGTARIHNSRWRYDSARIRADFVAHVHRQDRPEMQRGVSWFHPVAVAMQDLRDYHDAQAVRQKVAALMVAFRRGGDKAPNAPSWTGSMKPGAVIDIGEDEDVTIATPPSVGDFDTFTRSILQSIAAGLGLTYEALTGDLSGVNFSSARMGRAEMNRNISTWQWVLLVPQALDPIGRWFRLAWMRMRPDRAAEIMAAKIEWTPPYLTIVDPAREIPAMIQAVRAGFLSNQHVIRTYGFDPDKILQEQIEDRDAARKNGLVFDTDAALISRSGVTNARPDGSTFPKAGDETDE